MYIYIYTFTHIYIYKGINVYVKLNICILTGDESVHNATLRS